MVYKTTPYQTLGFDMYAVADGIHHAHYTAMFFSILAAFIGFVIAYIKYFLKKDLFSLSTNSFYANLRSLFKNKFYVDEAYQQFFINPFLKISKRASILDWNYYDQLFIDFWGWFTIKISKISAVLDYSFLDQFIVDGFARFTNKSGKELQASQNGILQSYLFSAIIGIIILLIIIQQLG